MGAGALLFIPAARVPSFQLFLAALIVLAAGITALQVAANPFVAVLGPPQTASSRLNLTQAFNSLGTTIAPFLGSLFILSSAPKTMDEIRNMPPAILQAYRLQQASSVKLPYRWAWHSRSWLSGSPSQNSNCLRLPLKIRSKPASHRTRISVDPASIDPGRGSDFCLRWRGSLHWKLSGELHEPTGYRQYLRADCGALRLALLGRGHDWQIHRIRIAAEDTNGNASRNCSHRRCPARDNFDAEHRGTSRWGASSPSGSSIPSCSRASSRSGSMGLARLRERAQACSSAPLWAGR